MQSKNRPTENMVDISAYLLYSFSDIPLPGNDETKQATILRYSIHNNFRRSKFLQMQRITTIAPTSIVIAHYHSYGAEKNDEL